jgi:hypothetical protein
MMNNSGKLQQWLRRAFSVAAVWCGTQLAHADVCFHRPSGVPGLPDEPVWFATAGKFARPDLNEPRWGAGPLMDFESAIGNAGYRLISNAAGDEMTLSLQALASTGTSPLAIYIGIAPTSTQARAVKLVLPVSGTNPIALSNGQSWEYTGSWPTVASVGVPTWVKAAAAWRSPGGGVQWAINLKVSLADVGVSPGSAYKMFLGISTGGMTHFSTPDSSGSASFVGGTIIPQNFNSAEWAAATAINQGCPGGVVLGPTQLGSDFIDPSTSAAMPWRVNTTVGAANSFHATPDYSAVGGPIAGTLKADFRIADWGSVADPAADWPLINATPVANNSSGTFSVSCAPATAANVCNVTGSHISVPDHCVQVSLSNNAGSTIPITQAAVFRNMIFAPASELRRSARVSLVTTPEFKAKPKDLYLLVQTNNMDPHGETKQFSDVDALDRLRNALEFRAPNPKDSPAPGQEPSKPVPGVPDGKAGKAGKAKLAASTNEGVHYPVLSAFQQLSESWPTYQVFPYYDAGNTVELEGTVRPRLHAMFPFGVFVRHQGVHYGFKHELETEMGVTLEEISPNFYHVKLPAGTTELALGVHISAEEKPLSQSLQPVGPVVCPDCVEDAIRRHEVRHCHCRLVGAGRNAGGAASIALLLGLVGLGVARRRRQERSRR